MYIPLESKKNGSTSHITSPVSLYQPKGLVVERTALVLRDYNFGTDIQNRGRTEFNNRNLIQEVDTFQRAFNSYVPPKSDDPDEAWRAQTVRPITRNKLISIASHVTATMLYPGVFAQNEKDQEDKDAALVMGDLVEYVIDNSEYSKAFLQAVITMLVDPACIFSTSYVKSMRTIKKIKEDGTWVKKEIIDEVLSGFIFAVVPTKELLIANFYENNIQKQRFLIRNKFVDYYEAEGVYGKKENWKYVQPGVRTVFEQSSQTFYDVKDEDMRSFLVNEVTYYNRCQDLELVFVNGILMTDPDQPNTRDDKMYPFAKSGYEPIGNGSCFYNKSAANKLGSDQDVVDTLYNMILDGTYLQLMPPMALYGSEEVDSSVNIPGMITSFKDPNTKLENIAPRSDLRAGLETIGMVERSIAESSLDNLQNGNAQGGDRTAREVLLLEKNANIALGLFGKQVRVLVEDIGNLILPDILQHMTVAQVGEITDDLKYRNFFIQDKMVGGQKVTKNVQFNHPTEFEDANKDAMANSFNILSEEGGLSAKSKIYKINAEEFRKIKYKCRVSADEIVKPSKALDKALNLEAYDRLIQNPVVDQEAITRSFLLDIYKPGESDMFIKLPPPAPIPESEDGGSAPFQQKGVNNNLVSQLTGSNSLQVAASTE